MNDDNSQQVRVIDTRTTQKPLPLIVGAGRAYAVLWPENGAEYRTFNVLEMMPGDRSRDLRHASECVYYVAAGDGAIRDVTLDEAQPLVLGSMVHIAEGDLYRIEAGAGGMKLIGGCVPVDPALYELADLQEGAA